MQINVREYLRGNQKWTIQKNWQQDEELPVIAMKIYFFRRSLSCKTFKFFFP
jgi:6-phosphogluconate dehydrogenase (decarboxylating)